MFIFPGCTIFKRIFWRRIRFFFDFFLLGSEKNLKKSNKKLETKLEPKLSQSLVSNHVSHVSNNSETLPNQPTSLLSNHRWFQPTWPVRLSACQAFVRIGKRHQWSVAHELIIPLINETLWLMQTSAAPGTWIFQKKCHYLNFFLRCA